MKLATLITAIMEHPDGTRLSDAGNRLYDFSHHAERYLVDCADDFTTLGWQQFDTEQDASYFGVWVNPLTYQTLSYAEGDWSLVCCDSPAAYNAEVQSMIDFYDEGFIAKTIGDDGVTVYRQDRSTFLMPLTDA